MKITDQILDLFLDNPPNTFFNQLQSNKDLSNLKNPDTFRKLGYQLNREGYHSELIDFLNYATTKKNIFECSESYIADTFVLLYTRAYYNTGNYNELIKVCEKFKLQFPNSTLVQLSTLNGIALGEKNIGNYQNAFEKQVKIVEIVLNSPEKEKYFIDLHTALSNLGIICQDLKYYDKAYFYYNKCLKVLDKIDKKVDKTSVFLNISECLAATNRINEAISIVNECLISYKKKHIAFNLFMYKLTRLYKVKFLLQNKQLSEAKDILDDFIPVYKNTETHVKNEAIFCYLLYLYYLKRYNLFIEEFKKNKEFILENMSHKYLEKILVKLENITNFMQFDELKNECSELRNRFEAKNPKHQFFINEATLNQEIIVNI